MSQLKVKQSIKNGVWTLQFAYSPEYFTADDLARVKAFVDPEIDIGGTIEYGSEQSFQLPTNYVKIYGGFPLTVACDQTAFAFQTDTQARVEALRDSIVAKVTAAFVTLRALPLDFVGERVYTV